MHHHLFKKAATLLIGSLIAAAPASAATRTVCLQFKIADDRTDCPESGDPGARRVCVPGGYGEVEGWLYELWDKDDDGNDEYIGTWRVGGTGRRCVTFEWENSSYDKGEANPDVYPILKNRVEPTGGGVRARGVDGSGTAYSQTTWRDGSAVDDDAYLAENCTTGASCQIVSGASLLPTSDTASNKGLMLMALDSAQRALQTFGSSINDTDEILIYVDELADLPAPCDTACAEDRTAIYIPDTLADDGDRATHEMGHVFQMREFGQDYLRDDCSLNGDGWSVTGEEYDSCSTTEGFASYVGIASWYDPNHASSAPFYSGFDAERATPQSATASVNAGIALQVTKAFWDYDDAPADTGTGCGAGYDDTSNSGTTWLLNNWDVFSSGTADRKDYESGSNGVNMWDYDVNTGLASTTTFIYHNCLDSQEYN